MNRKYSLKKNKDIDTVFNMKKSIKNTSYTIYLGALTNKLRIAISISKRCGNAVVRNYEKRIVKEVIRPFLEKIIKRDYLIVIKEGVTKLSFSEKKEQLTQLLKKISIQEGDKNE